MLVGENIFDSQSDFLGEREVALLGLRGEVFSRAASLRCHHH